MNPRVLHAFGVLIEPPPSLFTSDSARAWEE